MHPPLFKKDKKGGTRVWKITVTGNLIEIEHGLENGEKIKTSEPIMSGKNIGRKNETSPEQQANLEAKSRWKKKKDTGYSETLDSKAPSFMPMLAHDFKKHKNKMKFPVNVQPKLDGYRMVYDSASCKMFTRTGKEYTILEGTKLHSELKSIKGLVLDGELYCHSDFQFESYGVLRKKKLTKNDLTLIDKIKYHIYDTISPGSFTERFGKLQKVIKNFKHLELVKTVSCNDEECINKINKEFVEQNYEGSMIRNPKSLYVSSRSHDLLKNKLFDDAEFKVIGFEKEIDTKGDGASPVVWVCESSGGKTFKVASKGTREERTKLYENGRKYTGKMLTVQFFGLTADGIPRFPKTLRPGALSFRLDL
jgi:DNA ligase-1